VKHHIPPTAKLTWRKGDPQRCFQAWRPSLAGGEGLLLVDFQASAWWLDYPEKQSLTAIYWARGGSFQVAVTDQALQARQVSPQQQYLDWLQQHQLFSADPTRPLGLRPESIAKPWGREIWFTGVERRGVCRFARGRFVCPIPWLQAVLPDEAAGAPGQGLVLLKILDPSPRPETGELYFELHRRKRELYVVTGIDPQAWPGGVGQIRFGFDPQQVSRYPGEQAFRKAYLESVQAYEAQRRALDAMAEQGVTPGPTALQQERELRAYMNRFTRLLPVRRGDVIAIPRRLPHALQHGVRVVEFQTPEYERMILSFGQKVLTQPHWDTCEAVPLMDLVPAPLPVPTLLEQAPSVRVEQLGAFPEFEVYRATIAAGTDWVWDSGASYSLALVVGGELVVAGESYTPEQALLFPRAWRGSLGARQGAARLEILLARPRR